MQTFEIGPQLTIIAGPCVIESEAMCIQIATELKQICSELGLPYIFKASYDKANRTSLSSFRGPGLDKGLKILTHVRDEVGVPVYTDIHTPEQAAPVAKVCAALQIPAFLCRQTDLLVAAAKTGKPVAIKKGQFMAPWDMGPVVEKVRAAGGKQIVLIDRGTTFGYNNLVCDMRAMSILKTVGNCPVCFDATHAVQLPGGQGTHSDGQVEFVKPLALAAIAAGADALFLECHPNPSQAKSDAASQLPLNQVSALLRQAKAVYEAVRLCS